MFSPLRLALPLCCALFLLVSSVQAEDEQDAHEVDVMQTFVLDAPRDEVWQAFTDETIAQKWFAPLMKIDLRTGGSYKATYNPAAGLDGPGVITHHILAIDAPRLAVMRTSVKEGHPFYGLIDKLVGTWRFEALPGGRTRLHLGMHGWPDTPRSRQVQGYFKQMNPQVLAKLQALFPKPPSGAEALQRMATIVGEYDATLEMGGRTLQIHKSIRKGPGGKGFICITSFGAEGARRVHKHEQVWIDAQGIARFNAIDEGGGQVAGRLLPEGDGAVVWNFEQGGRTMRLYMSADKGEAHTFRVEEQQKDGTWKPHFSVDYKRAE